MKIANFEFGVCSGAERFVSDQDLEKTIAKVLKTFEGVENLSAEQRDGIANFILHHNVLAAISINSWTLCRATAITQKVQL